MAKVNWINGKIAPPESGEYYVILEAQQDIRDPDTASGTGSQKRNSFSAKCQKGILSFFWTQTRSTLFRRTWFASRRRYTLEWRKIAGSSGSRS